MDALVKHPDMVFGLEDFFFLMTNLDYEVGCIQEKNKYVTSEHV